MPACRRPGRPPLPASDWREDGETVTLEALREKKLVNSRVEKIVVLASGELTSKVNVVADRITKGAREAILAKGGTIQEPAAKSAE